MAVKKTTTYLLTGDIGGTNSRMGLYTVDSPEPLVVRWERNQDRLPNKADGIFERNVIAPFLRYCWEESDRKNDLAPLDDQDSVVEIISCLAVAGPVANNAAAMSNLHGIVIDGTAIVEQRHNDSADPYLAKIKGCAIINDFVAQGYGCLTVEPHEVQELVPGSHAKVNPSGPIACVGAGTGLGECFLTPNDGGVYSCFASEGGHVEYAPRSDLEVELWRHLMNKFGYSHRVSVERVVSGRGLANVYEFLAKKFPDRVVASVHEEFLGAGDMQGKVVAVNATDGSLCKQALEIMMATYGSEVGSTGVKFIPTGGLYVTGGLTPKNIKFMTGADSPFMKACLDKGRVSHILNNVPIFAVLVEDLGVRGAYKCAQIEYEKYKNGPARAVKNAPIPIESSGGDNCLSIQFCINKTILKAATVIGLGVLAGIAMRKKK